MPTLSTRLHIPVPTLSEAADVPAAIQGCVTILDLAAVWGQGLIADLPAVSGITGRIYFATDTQKLYASMGTAWYDISGPHHTYGTAFPTSPNDGDVHVLVDSVTTPAYHWHMRYNAASTNADKWEYIGGRPSLTTVDVEESTTSGSYTTLSGPVMVCPRGGVYRVHFGHTIGATAPAANRMAPQFGITSANDGDSDVIGSSAPAGIAVSRRLTPRNVSAGQSITMNYKSATGAVTSFLNRWLEVYPVRLS